MKIVRSKYQFCSSSKSKAWDILFETGDRVSLKLKLDAIAAVECYRLGKAASSEFAATLPIVDFDGQFLNAVDTFKISDSYGMARIASNNKYQDTDEVVPYSALLGRMLLAIEISSH